jgi:cytochrome c biogenesis factor
VAVLATVFTNAGGYTSPQAYVDGLVPAVWVGAAVLAVGAVIALLVPGRRSPAPAPAGPCAAPEPVAA